MSLPRRLELVFFCDRGADETAWAAYRINTFPLIHLNIIHTILNVLALTPLLERFESEYGTLTTLALFFGREFSPVHPLSRVADLS